MSKEDKINQIRKEITNLKISPLYALRIETNGLPVIGEGSLDSKIMFIGEAPGKNEARTGKPFCGASGRVLDELLAPVSLKRENIYITNIVKDRPPENRDPTEVEITLYGPYLDREIALIEPRVIATLGRFAMKYVMEKFDLKEELKPIGEIHGRSFPVQASYGKVVIVPLYHPAVVVYNAVNKAVLKEDIALLVKYA